MLRDGYWALVFGHLAIVYSDVPPNEPSNGFNQFQSPSSLGSSANVLRQSMYDTACLVVPPRTTSFSSVEGAYILSLKPIIFVNPILEKNTCL